MAQAVAPSSADEASPQRSRGSDSSGAGPIWLVPLLVVVGCLVSAPVLYRRYGFVDDYTLLWQHEHGANIAELGISQGRPVASLVQWVAFTFIHGVSGLVALRAFAVLCMIATGVVVARAMIARGYSVIAAWTFAVGLFWLPSTAIMIGWAILAFGPLALLLAAGAAVLLAQASEGVRGLHVGDVTSARLWLSLLCLSTSVLAYQPAAMAFWPLVLLLLASPRNDRGWRRLPRPVVLASIVGVSSCVVGYLGVKVGELIVSADTPRGALVTDPQEKVKNLVESIFPYALYPWHLSVRQNMGFYTGLLLTVMMLVAFRGRLLDRLAMLTLAGAAITLGWLANLVIAENSNTNRTDVGVMTAQVVFVAIAVDGLARVARRRGLLIPVSVSVGVGVAAFAIVWMTQIQRHYFTDPASQELHAVATAVRQIPPGAGPIAAITGDEKASIARRRIDGEFGTTTVSVYWALQSITEFAYRDVYGKWPAPGLFEYPTDEAYKAGQLQTLPAAGRWVLDYRRLPARGNQPLLYVVPDAP